MTRADLNTAINTVFDDARADNSLTPSMEGNVIKLVADYIDQEITTLPIGAKTNGAISGGSISPYPELTYNLNTVNSNNINNKVVLPTTTEVGKEVLVFAANNSGSFSVMADQVGSSKISSGGISSTTGSLSIGANISARFIHINNGYWKAEII